MENFEINLIAILAGIILIAGLFLGITKSVVNPFAFIVSLIIIFTGLALLIIKSRKVSKTRHEYKPEYGVIVNPKGI